MNLSLEQQQFTKQAAQLIQYIFEQGYSATFGDAFRSEEQAALNAKKGIGIKDSLHCKRLAIDLNLFSPTNEYLTKAEDYHLFGAYWCHLDPKNRWGGDFKNGDANHFERNV